MTIQNSPNSFMRRDDQGKPILYELSESIYGFNDKFWRRLSESDVSPFLMFQQFVSEASEVSFDKLELFIRERFYFAEHDTLISNLRTCQSVENWLETPICVNLGLTVDSYSDYTLNVTYPAYGGRDYDYENKGRFDESSIMWLTRRQGYKQAELREALYQLKKTNKQSIVHFLSLPQWRFGMN